MIDVCLGVNGLHEGTLVLGYFHLLWLTDRFLDRYFPEMLHYMRWNMSLYLVRAMRARNTMQFYFITLINIYLGCSTKKL